LRSFQRDEPSSASCRSAPTREPRLPSVRDYSQRSAPGACRPSCSPGTFLERLERLGPRYNAVVTITRERALGEARRAEGEIAAGRWRGPLHGIPVWRQGPAAGGGRADDVGRRAVADADVRHRCHPVIQRLEAPAPCSWQSWRMVELRGRRMGYRQPNAVVHPVRHLAVGRPMLERRVVERLRLGRRRRLCRSAIRLGDVGLDPLARALLGGVTGLRPGT